MNLPSIHPVYKDYLAFLQAKAAQESLWRDDLRAFLLRVGDIENLDQALQCLHEAQRLRIVFIGGIEHNQDFRDEYQKLGLPLWGDFSAPPVAPALQYNLAEKLYNARHGDRDRPFVYLGDGAREIGAWLVNRCIADGFPALVGFSDPSFDALAKRYMDDAGITALAEDFLAATDMTNTRISVRPGIPDAPPVANDPEKARLYSRLTRRFSERVSSGDMFFTLTVIPTRKDAEIDDMDYDQYVRLFFEMCDQPWDAIDAAHRVLIDRLNAGKHLRFTNDDGTDVSMDIDGFTFCNSLIAKNVPGSEVFSAPRKDSVNGTIVAKGRFTAPGNDHGIIEDLTLTFKDGYLTDYAAASGLEHFEKAINMDDGARYVGEVGIGTNPYLKTHVANGLLVEKIGGSFHLALGRCYTMTDYEGDPVRVDNGNDSALHWDITTMLWGKQGRIELDGTAIMEDGKFVDPALDVLNRGWAAVDEGKRPQWWRGD